MLFAPWPPRRATLTVVLAGLLLFVAFDRSAEMNRARWDVDEGQRIGESYFLRLLQQGEVHHPDWFRFITDSSHPQMNKYCFGLAARLHGVELPRDLALPRHYEDGGLETTGWTPPPHLLPVYEPMLRPARRAALLCNVVSLMVVSWLLLRWWGLASAAIAATLFLRHYIVTTYVLHAVSDALIPNPDAAP